MVERPRQDVSDGRSWWCRQCKTRKSIRNGSFFSKSKLTLQTWLILLYNWARDRPVTDAMDEAEVDTRTAVDIYQWLREVCTTSLLANPVVLGGPGVVVQFNESLFRHKPKVASTTLFFMLLFNFFSQQHHRGCATTQEIWVFGLVDVSQSPAKGYMEIVHRRDAATLLPIIQAHVAPGTVIHSDQWAACHGASALPNVSSHQSVVNHSIHFVDPTTGVHTQHIESYWKRSKIKLKRMKGCTADQLSSYLDEFMWKERHGSTRRHCFTNICRDIAAQYPVP